MIYIRLFCFFHSILSKDIFLLLILLQGKDYFLHLGLPNYPSCSNCTVDVSWDLQVILNQMTGKVCDFQKCSTLQDIIKEVTSLIVILLLLVFILFNFIKLMLI